MMDIIIGVDILKDYIDFYSLLGGQMLKVVNDCKGFVVIFKWIGVKGV